MNNIKGVNLPVKVAAQELGVNPQFLRKALQDKVFPFGIAIKTKDDNMRFAYFINKNAFYDYISSENKEIA